MSQSISLPTRALSRQQRSALPPALGSLEGKRKSNNRCIVYLLLSCFRVDLHNMSCRKQATSPGSLAGKKRMGTTAWTRHSRQHLNREVMCHPGRWFLNHNSMAWPRVRKATYTKLEDSKPKTHNIHLSKGYNLHLFEVAEKNGACFVIS